METLACPRPDFLVINVIEEEEEAMETVFKGMGFSNKKCRASSKTESHYHFHTKAIKVNGRNRFLAVAHVRLSSHTNVAAAALIPKILVELKPAFVIVTGIAGGVKGKVNIGDIVVPTSIRYPEYMRVEPEKAEELEALGIDAPDRRLQDTVHEIKDRAEWRERLKREPGYVEKDERIEVRDEKCVIESFEKMIEDWTLMKGIYGGLGRQTAAIDMESFGIGMTLSENRYEGYLGYLVIRGISDIIGSPFQNADQRQLWKKSASKAAAVIAVEIMLERDTGSINMEERSEWRSKIEKKATKNLKHMMSTYPCVEWLPVNLKSGNSEATLEADPNDAPDIQEGQLSTRIGEYLEKIVDPERITLISGPAGSSKSLTLNLFSKYLLEKGQSPLLVEIADMADELNLRDLGKYLASEFAEDLVPFTPIRSIGTMERISESNGDLYLMIDGLNEILGGEMGERTDKILELIGSLKDALNIHGLRVIVTHRRSIGGDKVNHIEVRDIPKYQAEQLYDDVFGRDAFRKLPDDHQKLLQRPFFIYRCLSERISMRDEAELVEKFLELSVHPKDNAIDMGKLAQCTYETYRDTGTWHYETESLKKGIGEIAYNALKMSDIFLRSDDGKSCWFQHQLYADYLVGKHISTLDRWSPEILDATTLQSGSYEPVDIAVQILERIGDKLRVESSIKEVYDWSWSHALTVVGSVRKDSYFRELSFAVFAIILEKLKDNMPHTRNRTTERVEARKDIVPIKLLETAGDVDRLAKVIESEREDSGWFSRWKSLYGSPADILIKEILSSDSVIGWTAANVFKRKNPSRDCVLKLVAEFQNIKEDTNSKSVRWRIIHALGKTHEKEGLDILEYSFSSDTYEWVRYGAARCLIETAATRSDIREEILKFLRQSVSPNHKAVNEEIARSLFYDGSDKINEGWVEFIRNVRIILKENDSKNVKSYEDIEKQLSGVT